ncbi:MAG: hypothetical protein H7239_15925 [Flavobacterium sp.]|nr:hypothetical protein [Flavobacterium sp.]
MNSSNTQATAQKQTKSEAIMQLEFLAFTKQQKQYPNFPYPIKSNYTDATSNGLTKCVIDYIKLRGFHAERINSTGATKDNRKTSTDVLGNIRTIGSVQWIKSTTQNGTADISATIQGRTVKIEIKCKNTGDRYQSEAQKEYQKQIENAGGIYIVVRTFEDFYNWFNPKKQQNE